MNKKNIQGRMSPSSFANSLSSKYDEFKICREKLSSEQGKRAESWLARIKYFSSIQWWDILEKHLTSENAKAFYNFLNGQTSCVQIIQHQ